MNTLNILDREIRYDEKSKNKKTIVFFIHGMGALPKFYNKFLSLLSNNYRIISPMLPGLGYVKNPPITIEENTKILKQFIASFNFGEYIIIGHSIGANIAQEIAKDNDSCKKVIMVNPALAMNLLSLNRSLNIAKTDILNSTGELMGLVQNPSVPFGYTKNILTNTVNYVKLALAAMTVDHTKYQYSQKCLLLYSKEDIYFELTETEIKQLQLNFSNLTIKVLDKYSHNWVLYFPEAGMDYIEDFLNQ